jgi:hypothetical protein
MRFGRVLCVLSFGVAALLNGCGGSIGFTYGDDFWDDIPPSVSLASSVTTVRAGQSVHFIAAASDSDSGMDRVSFYRLDGQNASLLGTDTHADYEWDITAPTDGSGSLVVFARAYDDAGIWADSVAVTITVTP